MESEETTMRGIKYQEQQDVASQIEAFLASGKAIKQVDFGVSAIKEGKKWGTDPIDIRRHEEGKKNA